MTRKSYIISLFIVIGVLFGIGASNIPFNPNLFLLKSVFDSNEDGVIDSGLEAGNVTVDDTGDIITATDVEGMGQEFATNIALKLNATGDTATSLNVAGLSYDITALGNLGATPDAQAATGIGTITGTLTANCAFTWTDASLAALADDAVWTFVAVQDGTGGRSLTFDDEAGGTDYTFTWTGTVNPRASTQTTIYLRKIGSSTTIEVTGAEPITYAAIYIKPQDLADAVRDDCFFARNSTGKTRYITAWRAYSKTDDTSFGIEIVDADGANRADIDSTCEVATNETGQYSGGEAVASVAWANGKQLRIDFNNTDDPADVYVEVDTWD